MRAGRGLLGTLGPMTFVAAVGQFTPTKGDVPANLDRIAELARQAASEGADLLALPETATTAYFLEGGVLEHAMSGESLRAALEPRLAGLPRALDLVVGFYERAEGHLYNSVAYLEVAEGLVRLLRVYRKLFLPTYGVFDEERFVGRGHDLGVVQTRFGTIGLLICEDLWHSVLATLAAVRGAQVLVVPSASPARNFEGERPGNVLRYERMLRAACEEHGCYGLLPMLCGFEGGKALSGGSMIMDPLGRKLAEAPLLEDHLLLSEIDLSMVEVARAKSPLLSDLQGAWSDIVKMANES